MPWVYLENPKRSAMLCKSAAMRRRRRTPLGALAGWALGARRDHSFMDTNSPAEAQLGCVWAEPPGWWRRIPCHRCHAFDDAKPGFQECEPTILSAKRDARLTEKLDLEADGKIYTSRRVLTHPGLVKVQEPTGHAIHPGRRRQALLPGRQEEIGALQHVRELKEKGPPQ
ncbi:unnamed protein product [Durusdinium trenchii]|uniref:Uncharacterized protein n=1 Tax=Durusdinium trenchii TaxID=1381693 RepID=A0ABP0P4K8_9DINO